MKSRKICFFYSEPQPNLFKVSARRAKWKEKHRFSFHCRAEAHTQFKAEPGLSGEVAGKASQVRDLFFLLRDLFFLIADLWAEVGLCGMLQKAKRKEKADGEFIWNSGSCLCTSHRTLFRFAHIYIRNFSFKKIIQSFRKDTKRLIFNKFYSEYLDYKPSYNDIKHSSFIVTMGAAI